MQLSAMRISPLDMAVVSSAYPGMTIFAAKGTNEYEAYAQLKVSSPMPDVHFTPEAAGFGPGQKPPPPTVSAPPPPGQGGFAGRINPEAQQQQAAAPPVEEQGVPGGDAAVLTHGASLKDAYGQAGEEETAAGGSQQSQKIMVPGLGLIDADKVPPEARKRIMAQMQQQKQQLAMQQQMAMQQQQMALQQHGPQYKVPSDSEFPNYDRQKSSEQEKESWLAFLGGYEKYAIPIATVLFIVFLLYLMVKKRDGLL